MVSDERKARRLAGALEPFAGQVYFSPECHDLYEKLGFAPSPGRSGGVALPDGPAYFCSRGSILGQVPGEVVAATFAVFNPAVVVPAVSDGWSRTTASAIGAARTDGAVGQLCRLLGENPPGAERLGPALATASAALGPHGRPLFAGLLAQPVPEAPVGAAWRYADRLREYRGDVHIAAWTSAGFDAVEIGLLTELYWGLPLKSYIRTRAWSEQALDQGIARLESRRLIADGQLTDGGRRAREEVEVATDRLCAPIVETLGDAADEVIETLAGFSATVREGRGYPGAGPHDLAADRSGPADS